MYLSGYIASRPNRELVTRFIEETQVNKRNKLFIASMISFAIGAIFILVGFKSIPLGFATLAIGAGLIFALNAATTAVE